MRLILVAWWVCCVGVAWWVVRGDVPPLMWVVVVAATMFCVLVWRCSPYRGVVRLAVYLSALVANQATAATAGFWSLLPGHHQHEVSETVASVVWTASGAVVAVATFLLVRAWVSDGGRRKHVARRQRPWRTVAGLGATIASVYMLIMFAADDLWRVCGDVLGIEATTYPFAHGQFGDWVLAAASASLAGAVEEPVYVGLLVLLWPRLRAKTFVPLAVLSSVARSVMHLYYAVGAQKIGTAVLLIMLWCVLWSSAALFLIYRTRLMWPVIVGHGMFDVFASYNGPFQIDGTPLQYAVVVIPLVVFVGIFCVAYRYGMPRLTDGLTRAITQRWRLADQIRSRSVPVDIEEAERVRRSVGRDPERATAAEQFGVRR